MNDLSPLQQRLDHALARIRTGIEQSGIEQSGIEQSGAAQSQGPTQEELALAEQLQQERARTKQLAGDLHGARLEIEAMRVQMDLMREKHNRENLPTSEEVDQLTAQLSDERQAVQDLEARVNALTDHLTPQPEAPAPFLPDIEALASLELSLHGLQKSNAELRAVNEQLRVALSDQIEDVDLINTAMRSELEGLRAARHAEATEVAVILDAMQPLINGAG